MSKNQDDFRKILATPRITSGSKAPPLFTPSRTSKLNPFKKPPPRIRREGRSDVLEHSHVDLGSGFIDRAKERRLAELKGENEQSGEVKGLDFELLKKVRSGEFVLPKFEPPKPQRDDSDDSDEEKEGNDMDEDAILDELLQMEMELQLEQERAEKENAEEKLATVAEEPVVKDTGEEGALPEAPAVEQQSRFKPIVDAKQMKQLRRERKRRKLAMDAMDRLSKPMAPPPVPKKSRAELLEQLRQIQAAKKLQMSKTAEVESTPKEPVIEKEFISPLARSTTKTNIHTPIPPELKEQREATPVENAPPDSELPIPVDDPPRQKSPPVKVGDNMFSDDSELSDYNPYADDSDEEYPPITTKPKESTVKRNYFDDKSKDVEPSPSGPITLDPTIAAALRKAASLADKRGIPEQVKEEQTTKNRMSLGGADGVYEFDEDDTWDGEEDDEISSRKRKRKEKKT